MKNREIMTPNPQWVSPETTLAEAARMMQAGNVGMLPVCQDRRLVGVLTDRDVAVRVVAPGRDPNHTVVRTVMSRVIISCRADEEQATAASMMKSHHVRRLPVLDEQEQLVGIISLSDLAVRPELQELALQVLGDITRELDPLRALPASQS